MSGWTTFEAWRALDSRFLVVERGLDTCCDSRESSGPVFVSTGPLLSQPHGRMQGMGVYAEYYWSCDSCDATNGEAFISEDAADADLGIHLLEAHDIVRRE